MKSFKLIAIFFILCFTSVIYSQKKYQDVNEKLNQDFEIIKSSHIKSKTVVTVTNGDKDDSSKIEERKETIHKYNEEGRVVEILNFGNELVKNIKFEILYDSLNRIAREFIYSDNELVYEETFVYNHFNKISESNSTSLSGKITKCKYYYDKLQNLLEIKAFKNDTTFITADKDEYDEFGRLKMRIERFAVTFVDSLDRGLKYEYSYDEGGKLIQEKQAYLGSNNSTMKDYYYDEFGRLETMHTYYGASKESSEEVYFYDLAGNIIKKIYSSKSQNFLTRFVYDENRNLLEEQYCDENDALEFTVKYIYEYF
jgi:hypothetical protein